MASRPSAASPQTLQQSLSRTRFVVPSVAGLAWDALRLRLQLALQRRKLEAGIPRHGDRMWPDTRLLDLLGIWLPIVQAPMAGAVSPEMVIQVSEAGGLGSLPCAMLTPEQARNELG